MTRVLSGPERKREELKRRLHAQRSEQQDRSGSKTKDKAAIPDVNGKNAERQTSKK
jgi:hypothetical protein